MISTTMKGLIVIISAYAAISCSDKNVVDYRPNYNLSKPCIARESTVLGEEWVVPGESVDGKCLELMDTVPVLKKEYQSKYQK